MRIRTFMTVAVVLFLCIAAFVWAETIVGSVTGTGADLDIKIGRQPNYVKVTNIDNGSSLEWFSGMTADSAIKTTASAISNTSITNITSNGISAYAGTINNSTGKIDNAPGFSVGADTDVNINTKTLRFLATYCQSCHAGNGKEAY